MAAAAVGASATLFIAVAPALATSTYTVSGGTSFTATTSSITLRDTSGGGTVICSQHTATGSVVDGSGLSGSDIATISASTWTGCDAGQTPLNVAQNGSWYFNATSGTSSSVTGNVSDVDVSVSGTCSFDITGTLSSGSYTDSVSGGTLAFSSATGLSISSATTPCHAFDIYSGDGVTLSATYSVTGSPTNPISLSSP